MTEPAPATPRCPRRRVLLGALGLVVLAAGWMVMDTILSEPKAPWRAAVMGFKKSVEGTSIVAVVTFTNSSSQPCGFMVFQEDRLRAAQFLGNNYPTNIDWWIGDQSSSQSFREVRPGQGRLFTVAVPQDGRIGMLYLMVTEKPRVALKIKTRLRALLGGDGNLVAKELWIWCDEVIQCPRVLPDGTVEPPRLLPKVEGKQ